MAGNKQSIAFSIRDIFWFTLAIGLLLGWSLHGYRTRHLSGRLRDAEAVKTRLREEVRAAERNEKDAWSLFEAAVYAIKGMALSEEQRQDFSDRYKAELKDREISVTEQH